jgi:3-deoxy-D-manno-octulosonic acid kinase
VSRPALPAGYVTGRERGADVVALPSVFQPVLHGIAQFGTLHDAAAADPDARAFTGRGTAYHVRLGDEDAVVRHYQRGGVVARMLHDSYLAAGQARPLRELAASCAARERGVDTPEVLALATYPAAPFYRADIATRYISDSRDLAACVLGETRADRAGRLAAWTAAGTLLRTAFAAGVEHADLNMRNILIADVPRPRALLLDLDRAVVHTRATGGAARDRMIARLHRSRRKLESQLGTVTDPAEIAAFEDAILHG